MFHRREKLDPIQSLPRTINSNHTCASFKSQPAKHNRLLTYSSECEDIDDNMMAYNDIVIGHHDTN